MKTRLPRSFVKGVVVLLVVLCLCLVNPAPTAAQSLGDYFQIIYDPVVFSKNEIYGSEVFYATIRGRAVCTNDLPVSVSEARITSRVVAKHSVTGAEQVLNSSYTVYIKPFPNKKGQSYEISQQIPLQFPGASPSGEYTVVGELIKAEVKAFIWYDVTSRLPQSQEMGSVKYTAPQVQSPAISFSPLSFTFTASEHGNNPSSQNLSIWNSGGGTLNWSVSSDASWLNLSPTSGSSTGETDNVTVSVNISGMSAGSYNATITIYAPEATNNPRTVQVNLTLNPPSPATTTPPPSPAVTPPPSPAITSPPPPAIAPPSAPSESPPSPPVTSVSSPMMWVAGIDMSLNSGWWGLRASANARVTIVDSQGKRVSGAVVSGRWGGAIAKSDSGMTDSQGIITFNSDTVWRTSQKTFTLTVDSVTKSGWTYNPGANIEITDSVVMSSHKVLDSFLRLCAALRNRLSKALGE